MCGHVSVQVTAKNAEREDPPREHTKSGASTGREAGQSSSAREGPAWNPFRPHSRARLVSCTHVWPLVRLAATWVVPRRLCGQPGRFEQIGLKPGSQPAGGGEEARVPVPVPPSVPGVPTRRVGLWHPCRLLGQRSVRPSSNRRDFFEATLKHTVCELSAHRARERCLLCGRA